MFVMGRLCRDGRSRVVVVVGLEVVGLEGGMPVVSKGSRVLVWGPRQIYGGFEGLLSVLVVDRCSQHSLLKRRDKRRPTGSAFA